ncbi:hypothetical protein [Celeribacter sp. PS-C1]|uniref:hypothetical protein n=1 Tax=Celeribacter sp. PS-C1 TaxID=2820813 RepID=UPI001CA56D3B|nr:hypothetical protein [Celeribacter sp. PS-C1]MBW6419647.1 hypothetical protein [Celeribacter sp. PS-C1]
MFDNTRHFTTPLHEFAREFSEAVQNTALLLGGLPYLRCAGALLDDLQEQTVITRKMRRNALALRDLLHLEHVHDVDRPEAAYFAELHPEMPVIEDICLLADRFDDALLVTGILSPDDVETYYIDEEV